MSTTNIIREQLDEVKCLVRPYNQPLSQYPMIDTEEIAQKFTEESVQFLKSQGVNVVNAYTTPGFGATRGGLWFELLELLKSIKLLLAIIQLFKIMRLMAERVTDTAYRKGNIFVHVNLFIRAEDDVDEDGYFDDIATRLATMLRMAKASAESLQRNYPLYSFGFSVKIALPENEFSAGFSLNLEDGEYKYKKMCNIASHTRFVEGLNLSVSTARFGLFKHLISRPTLIIDSPHRKKDYRWIDDGISNYTLLSESLVGEFKYLKKVMPYTKYYDKYLK